MVVIRHITISEWYGIVVGGILVVSWVRQWRWPGRRVQSARGWLVYEIGNRRLPQIARILSVTTVGEMLFLLGYLLVNVLCILVRSDHVSIGRRAGTIALWNFLLLALGQPLCIPADLCGVSERTYRRCHRWVGRVCIVEVVIHGCAAIRTTSWHAAVSHDIASLIVCQNLAIISDAH